MIKSFTTLLLTITIGFSFGQQYHLKQVIGDSDAEVKISSYRKPFVVSESTIAYLNKLDETVLIFSKVNDKWEYTQTLADGNAISNNSYGEFIAIDGNELAISDGTTGENQGTIYYYEKKTEEGLWEMYDSLLTPLPANRSSSPFWGAGIVTADRVMPVGRTNGINRYAHILTKGSDNTWERTDSLVLPNQVSANFAITEDELIVAGHYFWDIDKLFSFSKNEDGTWNHDYSTIDIPDATGVRRFGNDMVIDGDYLLVGSPEDDVITDIETIEDAGSAFIFKKIDGEWVFQQRFYADTPTEDFGASVAIKDGKLLISDHETSSAVMYILNDDVWEKSQVFKSEGLDFEENDYGRYVDFSDDQVVVASSQFVHIYGTTSIDCNKEEDGTAFIDLCGVCAAGNTEVIAQTNTNTCQVVGVSDDELEIAVTIFPNPAQSFLTINTEQNSSVVIYSLLGDEVMSQALSNDETTLSLEGLQEGTYLIKITNQEGVFTETFIIK